MRSVVIAAILCLPFFSVLPQAAPLATSLDALMTAPAAARAHWGISVIEASTGRCLFAREDGKLFQPASNAKLFTTAAALALLGPNYTMDTRVLAEGRLDPDGTLHGSLRLLGGADPTLSGRAYPYTGRTERSTIPLIALDALAAQVSASGIHSLDGSVIADDTLFPDERYGTAWAWDDLQWEYGASISALPINDDVRYLTLSPGPLPGAPLSAAWLPDIPSTTTGSLLLTATTSNPGTPPALGIARHGKGLRVYGSLPANGQAAHLALALDDPAQFAADAFRIALQASGVVIPASASVQHRAPDDTQSFAAETSTPVVLHALAPNAGSLPLTAGTRVVAQRRSPPLFEIVTITNKVSQNLPAELLLRLLGRAEGDDGSAVQGARIVRAWAITQAHLHPDEFLLYDGSGLSSKDLVTPGALTALLRYSLSQPWGPILRASLPIAGVDGSLAARLPTLRGRVQAKTGTLSETDALSGFLIADSGRLLIFSILCNNSAGTSARPTIDSLVQAIAHSY